MMHKCLAYVFVLSVLLSWGCSNGRSPLVNKHAISKGEGAFTLYRLDGDRYPGEPAPEGAQLLHGWLVLQECAITSTATREKIFRALDDGIDGYGGGVPVDCFRPRHAIRIDWMGVTVDYLICFQCRNYYIYEGDKMVSGGNTTSSPKKTFDRILDECN